MAKNREANNRDGGGSKSPSDQPDRSEFGLTRPTGEMADPPAGDRPATSGDRSSAAGGGSVPPKEGSTPRKAAGGGGAIWKGFEHEDEYEPEVRFDRVRNKGNEDMDMTPMVDVVFLLLIFFMVTASFTLQKSIEQPASESDDPSLEAVEPEDEDDYIEVIIDQYNTYRLTSRNIEEIEAASDNEMRMRLRDMVRNTGARRLIIVHHGDATHEKVITAWDAGVHNGLHDVATRLTELDF